MKKSILVIILLSFCTLVNAQGIGSLNSLLNTYSSNIKVCNPYNPQRGSCIYNTNYMRAELQGKYLVLTFGFGYDAERGYIDEDVLKIDLSTATFKNGYWSKGWDGKWQQNGAKEILSITDDNGMDVYITGRQNYNQGTKQTLLSEFYITFGTGPIANRVVKEIYSLQEKYKAKEPWLVDDSTPQPNNTLNQPTPTENKSKGKSKPQLRSWESKMKNK